MASGPGNGSTPGARGGWSWTLKTENLMKDGKQQPSLSESLRMGAYVAHRRINLLTGADNRNFRRSQPLKPLHLFGEGNRLPSRDGSMLPVEAHLRLRRAGHNR